MPFTFGAATTDFANRLGPSFGANGQGALVMGWFYPTTLTAGRYYYSIGANSATANYGVKVGTTTSTLQMNSALSTPGLWTATADSVLYPSGITTGQWWFIAGLVSVTSAPATEWRMWLGTTEQAPTAMTVVNTTAQSGTQGIGGFVIGNSTTTGTTSFQGDIGSMVAMICTVGVNSPLPIATAAASTTDERKLIEETIILPVWAGQHPSHYVRDGLTAAEWLNVELVSTATMLRQNLSATATTVIDRVTMTTSGITVSAQGEPRSWDFASNVRFPISTVLR